MDGQHAGKFQAVSAPHQIQAYSAQRGKGRTDLFGCCLDGVMRMKMEVRGETYCFPLTRIRSLPKFWPVSIPMNSLGAFSRP